MLGISSQDNNADLESSLNLNDKDHEPTRHKLEPGKTMGSIPLFRDPTSVSEITHSKMMNNTKIGIQSYMASPKEQN